MEEAHQTAYALAAQRDYTCSELVKKLVNRGCSETTARAVVEQMQAKVGAPLICAAAMTSLFSIRGAYLMVMV
jgi:hypothetical protein